MKAVPALWLLVFWALVGCTTQPVQVKMLDNKAPTDPVEGPVFFLPTVEYVITVPLNVFAQTTPETPEHPPVLVLRVAPDREFTLRAESIADTRYALVLLDGSGKSVDLSVNEITLTDQSVLSSYNRTGEDKSGDILVSLAKVFFGLTGPFAVGVDIEDPPPGKPLGPAVVELRLFPSDIPQRVSGKPAPSLTTLFNKQSGTTFLDAFWSQNPGFDPTKFAGAIMDRPIQVLREPRDGPLKNALQDSSKQVSQEELEGILRKGVPGIPYRLPATEHIRFSYPDGPGGTRRQLTFAAKSPEGQPLLYAPVFGRRFARTTTAVEIHPDGSLKKYGSTRSSATASGTGHLVTAAEAWAKERKTVTDAKTVAAKLSYSLGAKTRALLEEKQKLTDEIKDLEAQIAAATKAGQPTVTLERQLRAKEAQRDVVQIKLDAATNGIDLP